LPMWCRQGYSETCMGGAVRAEGAPIDFVTHPPCC